MNEHEKQHRAILQNIAHRVMLERGLLPDFSPEALAELARLYLPMPENGAVRDLRNLLWCSIDNDDSLDLDQLTVAEAMPGGKTKILIAVADVDSLVENGSAIDAHARHNTTSVYTAAKVFPMLPERLSNGLTSLNFGDDRVSIVVETVIGGDGALLDSDIYRARVRNHAKLAYNSVAAWLEGRGNIPPAVAAVNGLAENLQLQDRAAQSLHSYRHARGALSLETVEAKTIFEGEQIRDLQEQQRNRATEIIENFMITANSIVARYLASKQFPAIRRVVRTPKRWDRIVDIAREHGYSLPRDPDSKALESFLIKEKTADPLRFPDLSLAVIKCLGPGEYIADMPGDVDPPGHFGLAVKDYAHSTAPNRRYTDLVTQRLVKAAMEGRTAPYSAFELGELAGHCTTAEDTVNKVERQVNKSAAALFLESRIGEEFDAIVTGAAPKGTWVRLLRMPVEGKLVQGFEGADVGDRMRVQLLSIDVERGFIDFKKAGPSKP
jgi:exoribonuclease-2